MVLMSFRSVFRTFAVCIVFSFLAAPAGAADDTAAARRILTRLFALPSVSADRESLARTSWAAQCRALHRAGACSLTACRTFMDDWTFIEEKQFARDAKAGSVRTSRNVTVPHVSEAKRFDDGRVVLFCIVRLEDELRHAGTGAFRDRAVRLLQVRAVMDRNTVTDLAFTELRQ